MTSIIERAAILAQDAHRWQVDKAGLPYISHPARVAARVLARSGSDEAVAAAWLHDVVEDTSVVLASIRLGFGDEVADIVDALTKRDGETRHDYYVRVCQAGPSARLVKLSDMEDNSDPVRLGVLDARTMTRLARNYAEGKQFIRSYVD